MERMAPWTGFPEKAHEATGETQVSVYCRGYIIDLKLNKYVLLIILLGLTLTISH
jgi:hypothetical protein